MVKKTGTLDVRVRGNSLIPPSLLGRFSILCAILRQIHLIIQITLLSSELHLLNPSAFFVDQLSAGLPLLKLLVPQSPIFFYCHFPDLLLVQGRTKWYKRLYRLPFDTWEEWSMSFADSIAVNSSFTKGIVSQTWPSLASKRSLEVVYPCIDVRSVANPNQKTDYDEGSVLPWTANGIILSINRFERKKDIALAIKAFASLSPSQRGKAKLIIAGGYDNRVHENVSYHTELVNLAEGAPFHLKTATAKTVVSALNTAPDVEVLFLLSVPNTLKEILLRSARLLVYTPSNEHFGIVPLEAMLRGVPVLAANNGGPVETVVEGETGWLRDPKQTEEWAKVMDKVLNGMGEEELKKMGRRGVDRVKGKFADTQMAERLEEIIERMPRGEAQGNGMVIVVVGALVAGLAGVASAVYWKLW